MPKQIAERDSRAEGRHEGSRLQSEPMFCFETALKLLKWSSLTYSDFGQGTHSSSSGLVQRISQAFCDASQDGGLIKGSLHGPCSWQASQSMGMSQPPPLGLTLCVCGMSCISRAHGSSYMSIRQHLSLH